MVIMMMKRHLVAAFLVAVFILVMAVMPLASAQTEVVIPSSVIEQGQSTTVPITIENTADAVSGITVNLWFNPAVVNVTGITQGDFPGSFTPNTANTADGWVRVVTEVGANPSLTDASIVVANVTIEAVGVGTSCSLGLEVVSLLNDSFQSIPYTPMNGTVTVSIVQIDDYWSLPSTGISGTSINATVNITNMGDESWFVVSISGAEIETGYPLVGLGTVKLPTGESVNVPVRIAVSGNADPGSYTLTPVVYKLADYPAGDPKAIGSGKSVTIS